MSFHSASTSTASPRSGIFGILLPRGLDADNTRYFRRNDGSFQIQSADQMGLGPVLRLLPLLAIGVAVAAGATVLFMVFEHADEISGIEQLAIAALGVLVIGLISLTSWLLSDLSKACIVDSKRKILWIGGGWLGRWEALNFDLISSVRVHQVDDALQSELPYSVSVIDADRNAYEVCRECDPRLARLAANDLAEPLQVKLTDDIKAEELPEDLAT